MHILYSIGIRIYYAFIWIAAAWNEKAAKWISGRKSWRENLEGVFSEKDKVVWFHCASLGEFEQGRPIIERVRKEFPEYKILLSFFSPSGFEKRKDYTGVDHVTYLPLDTARNARHFLQIVPVKKVFFIKYEFWYHFLKTISARNIPLFLASGNFRSEQLFFKWYGGWYRRFLHFFSHLFVQNTTSELLLNTIGIQHHSIAGDTRFERVIKIAKEAEKDRRLSRFSTEKPVIVAGSTWEKDESLLYEIHKNLSADCKWIIAPHEPTEKNIQRLLKQFENALLFSEISDRHQIEKDVIIVDTIGHLSSLYQYATLAYIGGGFGKGIHNILEAAAFGKPLIFGPNYSSFQEARDLLSCGAAHVIKQVSDGHALIKGLVNNEDELKSVAQIAENYIINQSGATDKIVDFVFIKGA